jgi:hypothetical protein
MAKNKKKSSSSKAVKKTSSSKKGSKGKAVVLKIPNNETVRESRINALVQSAVDKYKRSLTQNNTFKQGVVAETAMDRFVLGLYEPEIESRGPAMAPQNTFISTHRVNLSVDNADIGGTLRSNLAICVGMFPTNSSNIAGETVTNLELGYGPALPVVGVLTCPHDGGLYIGNAVPQTGSVPFNSDFYVPATTVARMRYDNESYWDSVPYLYAQGASGINSAPHRVVGLKVTLEAMSAPIYLQGSIRGGDNGTIALSSRVIPMSASSANGTTNYPVTATDTYDAFWPDIASGLTEFTRDPRVKELGPIRKGCAYEFYWIPTSPDQIMFKDGPAGDGYFPTQSGATFTNGAATFNAGSMIRKSPTVLIHLDGLSNTVLQSFKVRATLAVEHVVTPYGSGFLYDYSRKSPFFILPWDRMSMLPTSGIGTAKAVLEAGRILEDESKTYEGRANPSAIPSISRGIAGNAGYIRSEADTHGTINANGAQVAVGVGYDRNLIQNISGNSFGDKMKRVFSGAYGEAKKAINYGVEHEQQLKSLFSSAKQARSYVTGIEEVVEPLAIMMA